MSECDKCGNRASNDPWFSYYSPMGVATDILWRYCDGCKKSMISLYGIDKSYFSKAENDEERNEIEKEYNAICFEVRQKMRNMKV